MWKETGGADLAPPTHRGFGRELLEHTLACDLEARSAVAYERDGLSYASRIPFTTRIGRLVDLGAHRGADEERA